MRSSLLARRLLVALALVATGLPSPVDVDAQHPPVVRGTVVDASTGLPITGATVRVTEPVLETTTGPDGRFVLRGLLPGTRVLRLSALGYLERSVRIQARNGRETSLHLELRPSPLSLQELEVLGTAPADQVEGQVLEGDRIEEADATDLGELLQGVAGVTITRRGGPGAPAHPSIRGSSADEVLVLVDGVPVNSLLTGEADLSTIALTGVERVVVVPGGQSVRHGARALAGVILVETRSTDGPGLEAGTGLGSWGERHIDGTVSGDVRLGGETEAGGFLAAEWRGGEGDFSFPAPAVRGGGEDRRRNADHSRLTLRGAAELQRPSLKLRVQAQGFDGSRGMPGPVVQPSPSARQEQQRLGGAVTARSAGGSLEWEVSGDLQRQSAVYKDPDPPLGAPYEERVEVDALGFRGSAETRIAGLRLEGGAEVRGYGVSSTMLSEGAPDSHRTAGTWLAASWRRKSGDGTSLSLSPGVRVDWSSLVDGLQASPEVSASVGGERFAARLSVGNAFSPPSLADQFFQEGVLARPNPSLKPERLRGEVEGTVELREATIGPATLGLRLSAYRADVDGMILWLPDHRFVWQPDNFDVDRRGWEAEAHVRLPDRARARLSVSRADVEYDGPVLDGQVAYRPALRADARLTGRAGPLRPIVEIEYVGVRRTVPGSSLNTLDPYWRADAALQAGFQVGTWKVEPRVGVDNVFDSAASMLVDYPFPGRSWQVRIRVAPTRPAEPADSSAAGESE